MKTNLRTRKQNPSEHGIGLGSVFGYFENHGGYIRCRDYGDTFAVTGVINLDSRSLEEETDKIKNLL